jgi:hypothetical protein
MRYCLCRKPARVGLQPADLIQIIGYGMEPLIFWVRNCEQGAENKKL